MLSLSTTVLWHLSVYIVLNCNICSDGNILVTADFTRVGLQEQTQ